MASAEFQGLLRAARQIMKSRKITYARLAQRLNVSEATIKRFFTADDGSFGRLADICEVLGISVYELVHQAHEQREQVFSLTLQQEEFFAAHPRYFAFFQLLLEENMSPRDIKKAYNLNQRSLAKYLRTLDQLGLLEWLNGDRIRLKVSGTHNWLEGGPLQKKFLHQLNRAYVDYLSENFGKESHFFTTSDRYLHPDTLKALEAELRAIMSAYRKKAYRDEHLFPRENLQSAKWIVGVSPYRSDWGQRIANLE